MTPLKFRAWDKINNKFINLFSIKFNKDSSIICVEDIEGNAYGLHQIELQQFTGLTEHTGKELYEGDIGFYRIERSSVNRIEEYTGAIVFLNGSFVMDCPDDSGSQWNPGRDYWSLEKIKKWGTDNQLWESFKIIGNIFENSELLKQP